MVAYAIQRVARPHTYAIAYPREASQPLAAITVSSDLSPETDSVKLYGSGSIGKKLCTLTDDAIESLLSGATKLDVIAARHDSAWRVKKWQEAIPEFSVEHLERLQSFASGNIEDTEVALVFAGDYIGGPLIEGAFTSGLMAADRLHERLAKRSALMSEYQTVHRTYQPASLWPSAKTDGGGAECCERPLALLG